MERKNVALALLLLTAFAAVAGGIFVSAQVSETDLETSDIENGAVEDQGINWDTDPFRAMNDVMGAKGFGRRLGGCRPRFNEGLGDIELSSEYSQAVNDILDGDEDVQNLIAEGYSVKSIRPVVKRVVEADGTLANKATTAMALLENGISGRATVTIDVEEAKVTQIIIFTRTVIDKTAS